ncbi:MAG: 50S ribosomal protein L16 [bacterium]
MLAPKKVKFRKSHTFRENPEKIGVATRGNKISFGSFGLKAISGGRIKSTQIEAARKAISHSMSKGGKIWIRIFPDHPYTQKPAEVKMGKGKGELQGYVAIVKPGRVIFEVDGVNEVLAKEILRKGGTKLPVYTKFLTR